MESVRIIPLPRQWHRLPGTYELPQSVGIGYTGHGAEGIAKYLAGGAPVLCTMCKGYTY